MTAIADDAVDRFEALWALATNGLAAYNASGTTFDGVICRYYNGGVLLGTGTSAISAVAGSGTNRHPNYTAFVCSLHTDSLTRSGRGRMYLPATALVMENGTNGVFAPTLMAGYTDAVFDMLDTFNTGYVDESAEGRVAVLSRTQGTIRDVTAYSMDNKPDTQRGRNGKVVATSIVSRNAAVM